MLKQDSKPEGLQASTLMTHMRALCEEIGPRPSTSAQEREAAQYVRRTLQALGYEEILEQHFKSQRSLGWVAIPASLAAALGMPVAALDGLWSKLLGSLMLLGGTYTFAEFLRARPPVFQSVIARGDSQNVIAQISPTESVERHLFLVGHLDSQRQRLLAPPPEPALMKPMNTAAIVLGALGGLSLLLDILFQRKGLRRWQWLIAAGLSAGSVGLLLDEAQPHIKGANDNATAVAVLLGIAEALRSAPLRHTQVTLLFTGCEEVVCVGMESYLERFQPSCEDTYWIDLEMVGTGGLCYVTSHGISHLTEYTPHPEMVELAARTSRRHPELGVTGKEMLMLEEVSNLRHHGYKAICIAGYDEDGWLPNWHRMSDNLANIDPVTLGRAAQYTWHLLQEIDAL